jgi:hypothetical protein
MSFKAEITEDDDGVYIIHYYEYDPVSLSLYAKDDALTLWGARRKAKRNLRKLKKRNAVPFKETFYDYEVK